MAFKRALWHSGLTYRQICENCKFENVYMDDKLDFRPWYADGFIYCARCQTPLRHREGYAINGPGPTPVYEQPVAPSGDVSRFCTKCGRQSHPGDLFCGGCGNKLSD